VPFEEQIM